MPDYKLNFSKVKVMKDWGGYPLWIATDYGGWINNDYDDYPISQDLINRFEYWSSWFDNNDVQEDEPDMDWDNFLAYGLALAVDLKRELGDEYTVIWGHGDKEVKLKTIYPDDCPIAITHAKLF